MKRQRHHNNKGSRQIKRGKTTDQVRRMARRLKLPFHIARTNKALDGGAGE